ncbi:MAG: methyltransferase domain-containing protein [Acidobacteriota bacterium]|nr:methyltransferase domain-containing protein [Acidobacteriota bacterium]
MFKKRLIEPEVLDHVSPEEARPNLADLVRINEKFGGHSVLRKTLQRVAETSESFTLLDIGAGSGDSARVIQGMYPASSVTSLDYNSTNFEKAPYPKVMADAFALPFSHCSFDYVLCTLFLHHFEDQEVMQLLRGFYAVARRAVLVCDLERNIIPYLFLPASKSVFRWNTITVEDGMRSVRAAFRVKELAEVAATAGLANVEVEAYRPAFRLSLVAKK